MINISGFFNRFPQVYRGVIKNGTKGSLMTCDTKDGLFWYTLTDGVVEIYSDPNAQVDMEIHTSTRAKERNYYSRPKANEANK